MSSTQTLERSEWISYLAQFTRENRGSHAWLEIIGGELGDQFQVEDRPFDGIAADLKDNEDAVWIAFGTTPDDHIAHSIQQVTAIRVMPATAQRGAIIHVEAKDGVRTILRLSLPEEYALPPGERRRSERR